MFKMCIYMELLFWTMSLQLNSMWEIAQDPWMLCWVAFAALLLLHHWEAPGGHSGRWRGEPAAALCTLQSLRCADLFIDAYSCDHCVCSKRPTKVFNLIMAAWGWAQIHTYPRVNGIFASNALLWKYNIWIMDLLVVFRDPAAVFL